VDADSGYETTEFSRTPTSRYSYVGQRFAFAAVPVSLENCTSALSRRVRDVASRAAASAALSFVFALRPLPSSAARRRDSSHCC
jgi:hypothetical protein